MSEFILYEVTSYNDVEVKKEHTVKEVLHLMGKCSDVMVHYFHSEDASLKNNVNECRHYVTIFGDDLLKLIGLLDDMINSDDNAWYLYLRCSLNFPSHVFFYNDLEKLRDCLKGVLPSDSISNRERLFLYNILV